MEVSQIALAKKYGLTLRRVRGQHLLIDPNLQRKIVGLADPQPKERILEIGPGLGALTSGMLAAGAYVTAVETDRQFCWILQEELGKEYGDHLRIINEDILEVGAHLVCARDDENRRAGTRPAPTNKALPRNDGRVKVVSNLPYYITSPILFWLIENRRFIKRAVLMMQREVADRLLARPGNKDYGRLTLAVRYYAQARPAFHVSRNCFTPRPDVDSSVLTLDFFPPSKRPKGIDEKFLFHMIQTAFGARRKTILNRLSHDPKIGKSRDEISVLLRRLGISETARAENLLLKDFITLAAALGPR